MRGRGRGLARGASRVLAWTLFAVGYLLFVLASMANEASPFLVRAKGMSEALVQVQAEAERVAPPGELTPATMLHLDPSTTKVRLEVGGKAVAYRLAALDLSQAGVAAVAELCPDGMPVWFEVTESGVWLYSEARPSASEQAVNLALMSVEGAQILPTTDRYRDLVESIREALELLG